MPFNGSGVYSPPAASFPAVPSTLIQSSKYNAVVNDIATALTTCVTRDGQSPATANLPMASFRHLAVGNAATTDNYLAAGQLQNNSLNWGGTAGGTANALTLSVTLGLAAYVTGQVFWFKSGAAPNSAAATLSISSLATKAIQIGGLALTGGEILANSWYVVLYDGVAFQLTWLNSPPFTDANALIKNSSDTTKKVQLSASSVTTGTTRTLTSPDKTGTLALAGDANYYIGGLQIVNNGTTSQDIQVGSCTDGTNAYMLLNTGTITKNQNSWVAGSSTGGKMSAAAMANNTWYYFYAMRKDADGTIDFGFDVSPTAPTAQTGFSSANYRIIGCRKTQLAATNWETFIQHGDDVEWSTPPASDFAGAFSTSRISQSVNVPAVRVKWIGNIHTSTAGSTTQAIKLTDLACADVAPSITASPGAEAGAYYASGTGAVTESAVVAFCWTNTSSQIGVRAQTTSTGVIVTTGWVDPRGVPT